MTEGGGFYKLGRRYVWEGQAPGSLHRNHIFAVRPRAQLLTLRYLALVTGSGYGPADFTTTSKQSTNLVSTNSTKIRNLPTPLPNDREQNEIIALLDCEAGATDALVIKVCDAMDSLKEFRTPLISATVNGKIDVRDNQ